MCWAIKQAFRVQTQKNIKVFDENGDEASKRLDELCHQHEWDHTMHPIFIPDTEEEEDQEDPFERNVRAFVSYYMIDEAHYVEAG